MATVRCPICNHPFDPGRSPTMPFCSERCRMVDLGRWFNEEYSVIHQPSEEEEEGVER